MSDAAAELEQLARAEERCGSAFETVGGELERLRELLPQALSAADSPKAHDDVRTTLRQLAREATRVGSLVRLLFDEVDRFQAEWAAERRFTVEGVAAALEELEAELGATADGHAGARTWLAALLDAADAGAEDATVAIVSAPLPWPEELRAGVERLRKAFADWRDDGPPPDLEPVADLAYGRLAGWQSVLTPDLRSRAHRFAAWTALRGSGDVAGARAHLEEAVRLGADPGRMQAECAAFDLFVGDFDRAATAAQHAIEASPRDPFGYLTLGTWAELTGTFSAADDLYRRGLQRMPIAAVGRLHERSSLVDPPGRLLAGAASFLLEAGRPEHALELADEALLNGVRGSEAYPEAEVHILRRRALEQLPRPDRPQAAKAAVQAARLCVGNGDVDCAIDELGRALELDRSAEAAWLLADALLTKSYPLGAKTPNQELVAHARATWDDGVREAGLPSGATSWAYVTRAIVSDLESQHPDADRRAGLFEALMYVEKALVHNHTDAQRWGYVAQFLRYLGLEQTAFEAAETGYRLASADRQVLAERLPLLANRREFDEAERVAEQLVAMYGEDPWVSAVRAWLALHHRHDWQRTLELLRLPLAEGNDPAWYREMQALALLGLDRAEDAREAYRALLDAPPIDGNTKCRFARASLALGERAEASRWLAEARDDPTAPRVGCLMTLALAALAGGDLEKATRMLDEAIRLTTSAVEADDVVFETILASHAIDRLAAAADLEHAVQERLRTHKAWLERDPPTADAEIESALVELGDGPLDLPLTALLALAARRDSAAGRAERALERYGRLLGSSFEPEASLALERERRDSAAESLVSARAGHT